MRTTRPAVIFRHVKIGTHTNPDGLRLGEMKVAVQPGRVPRVSRLMRLAVLLHDKLRKGEIESMAECGQRLNVSRNRVTQILNLLLLAPDIAEEIMFLPRVFKGPDPIKERMLRPLTLEPAWKKQREMWVRLKGDQCMEKSEFERRKHI